MTKRIWSGWLILCLLAAALSLPVAAADANTFEDDTWGTWFRIYPEGEEDEIKPKNADGQLELSLHTVFAVGFASEDKIRTDAVKIDWTLKSVPDSPKGALYDGVSGHGIWYMAGLTDDQVLRNDSDWIFKSTGIYVMAVPKSETETQFMVRYGYPNNGGDENFAGEGKNGLVEPPTTRSLPIPFQDAFTVYITEDDITIQHKEQTYKFSQLNSTKQQEGAAGLTHCFDADIHKKAYAALGEEAHRIVAIFNTTPYKSPTRMGIQTFEATDKAGIPADASVTDPAVAVVKTTNKAGGDNLGGTDVDDGSDILLYVLIGLGGLAAVVVVGFVIRIVRKRRA